ncbi:uncharacterized protein LOC129914210 [Episyrphus balteatus]|uniref:uncharacterized protein LOC129914210 n=1 Tax=Episyrphus balteatus TaxID=286459 RepID=UPI0024855D9B|nr:uncharacterized protein LOC129914210 [Episyrphus balteatus]
MIKTKKQNKNSNSKAEEKTEKTIKKIKDEVSTKVKKLKGPKTAALVEAAAELVEASELPKVTPAKKDKKPKKEEVVVEESSSDIADESENEEDDEQIENDSDEEVSEDQKNKKPKAKRNKPVGYGRIIYVENFPTTFNRSKLASLFSPYGKILSIIFTCKAKHTYFNNDIGTNCAFIVFDDYQASSKALELNGKVVANQALIVRNPERKGRFRPLESVLVSNLKLSVTEDQIREVLPYSGKIEFIKTWRGTESKSAIAFIELRDVHKLRDTLRHNGTLLDGQAIQIDRVDIEKTVFVGGLNKSTTEDGLRNVFSSCGEIAFVLIKFGTNGYVIFKDTESVEKALKLDSTVIDESSIKVKKYIIKPKKAIRTNSGTYLGKKPNIGGKYLGKKPNTGSKYLGKKPFDPNFRKIKETGNKKPVEKVVA